MPSCNLFTTGEWPSESIWKKQNTWSTPLLRVQWANSWLHLCVYDSFVGKHQHHVHLNTNSCTGFHVATVTWYNNTKSVLRNAVKSKNPVAASYVWCRDVTDIGINNAITISATRLEPTRHQRSLQPATWKVNAGCYHMNYVFRSHGHL